MQPALTSALTSRDAGAVAALRDVLSALGRDELLQRCLAAAVEPQALALLERCASAPPAAGAYSGPAATVEVPCFWPPSAWFLPHDSSRLTPNHLHLLTSDNHSQIGRASCRERVYVLV